MKERRNFYLLAGGQDNSSKQESYSLSGEFLIKKLSTNEKELAAFFPLFGTSRPALHHGGLEVIIQQYGLRFLKFEDIFRDKEVFATVRLQNCLRNSKLRTLGAVLMMTPKEILGLKNFSKKTIGELQNIAKYILGIEEYYPQY